MTSPYGASRSHSDTPQSVGLLWTNDRPVAETSDNTQHSPQKEILTLGAIRTCNPGKRVAADPRLRPRGHWHRHLSVIPPFILKLFQCITNTMAVFWQHYKMSPHSFSTRTAFITARGGPVGGGTAMKAGRLRVRFPMVSLQFSIDIVLPAVLWLCGRLRL